MNARIVYGTQIVGELPSSFFAYFARASGSVAPITGSVDVSYREVDQLPELDEIWVESHEGAGSSSRFAVCRVARGYALQVSCQGRGQFRLSRQRIDIEWQEGGTAAHCFFSYALPLWLELNGVLVLHASAVQLQSRSIAFLGKSGAGKSSLAAALGQLGAAMVADDGLPVVERQGGHWACLPGPPLLRLWPSSFELLKELSASSFQCVHQGSSKRVVQHGESPPMTEAALKLAAIYLLERQVTHDCPVEIRACGDAAAPVRLLAHSLAGGPASALGLAASRFERLAALARDVPVMILRYPSRADIFARVRSALEEDLKSRPPTVSIVSPREPAGGVGTF